MDSFDSSLAPDGYQEIKWVADIFVGLMGLGWGINYICMVQHSWRDETYSMAIVPLCCNIAWEMVYVFVHPSTNRLEHVVFILGLCLNIAIIHAAIRFSPREWGHAPLVERNLPWIFAVGILACLSGHVALAAEIGPRLAYSWGAVVCQLLLSIGGLGQLLARESTRGGSYISWLGRALGSSCTVVFATIRYIYWPEAFAWLCSPLIIWSLTVFILTDTTYGVCFYVIHQREIKTKAGRAVQKGC